MRVLKPGSGFVRETKAKLVAILELGSTVIWALFFMVVVFFTIFFCIKKLAKFGYFHGVHIAVVFVFAGHAPDKGVITGSTARMDRPGR